MTKQSINFIIDTFIKYLAKDHNLTIDEAQSLFFSNPEYYYPKIMLFKWGCDIIGLTDKIENMI